MGLPQPKASDLPGHSEVVSGLAVSRVRSLLASGALVRAELTEVVPRSTIDRKLKAGGRLSPEESDRVARLLRLKALASDTLGASAEEWLRLPNPSLGGEAPLSLLRSDEGSRRVEAALLHLAHGDYS
ncbi:MAG: antitoxin Xre/MbcA/ParS toxin-binding domain-containing protein [Tistlia sp.]|uniref:antitoxin Xre/MbcA/ParS toxin-binding domain-containing protein n=1 Tax=Tistlia sp. TaxID=3057121 RepID=UPI0034A16B0B